MKWDIYIANQVTDIATANAATDGGQSASAVNGWYAIVGAAANELRDKAIAAARKSRYAVSGYVLDGNGWNVLPFNSADEADDWYGRLAPNAFVYAAYFDRSDPTFPAPLNEKLGEVVRATPVSVSIPRGGAATVSGNMAVTEATIDRKNAQYVAEAEQAAIAEYYRVHGAPPDTFGQLVEFVRARTQANVGAFHVVPWIWPFATGLFGGIIADQKFGSVFR